jgi:FtsP/CotA-like multicopper oxidase with cupredoxin domain
MFDDWLLADEGRIDPDFANLAAAAGDGRLGNWFTVNGQNKPYITLPPEKPVRLRLANFANSRGLNIVFKGADGLIIARDGQPISPQPLGLLPLQLEPGQRADVLVLEAQDQVVIALDLFEDVVEAAFLDAKGYGRKTLPGHLRLPANPVPSATSAGPMRDIPLLLEGGYQGGLQQARVGKDVLDLRAMLEQGLSWAIGGNSGLGSPPLFEVHTGELVALSFDNRTTFEQALHIHGHVWTTTAPVASDFVGPQPETRWSDTLVVAPKTTLKAYLVAGAVGTWAIQSLLAERSDAGLIGAFTVADMP